MKPKMIAYSAIHYASPYLAYAIQSVIDYIDEYHVLYSPDGSHGHKTEIETPESESRANLMRIARNAAGDKLHWHDGDWTHEGKQRDDIHVLSPDADAIIVLDYDEVWSKGLVKSIREHIEIAFELGENPFPGGRVQVPMWHYWRSFNHVIRHDPALPVRILLPKETDFYKNTYPCGIASDIGIIHHLGYAIPDYLMKYKLGIHGHKNEFRTDIDWYSERWNNPDAKTDLHPVGSEFWSYEEIDPSAALPGFMRLHPYWGRERIE